MTGPSANGPLITGLAGRALGPLDEIDRARIAWQEAQVQAWMNEDPDDRVCKCLKDPLGHTVSEHPS